MGKMAKSITLNITCYLFSFYVICCIAGQYVHESKGGTRDSSFETAAVKALLNKTDIDLD